MTRLPWVVGVSGASGTPYARAVLGGFLDAGLPVDLVVSRAARLTLLDETGLRFRDSHWADRSGQLAGSRCGRRGSRLLAAGRPRRGPARRGPTGPAAWSWFPPPPRRWPGSRSGCPRTCCNGPPTSRSRKGRPLVVVPRETPYTRATLQHLLELHDAGAVVLPASPGFYSAPASVDQLVDFVAAKVLDVLGVAARPDHPVDRRARRGAN